MSATPIKDVLRAVAEGYPCHGYMDRYIVVENPGFKPDNGADPNLVFDTWSLDLAQAAPTRGQLAAAIRKVLDKNIWPECRAEDDRGLEPDEYASFVAEVLAELPQPAGSAYAAPHPALSKRLFAVSEPYLSGYRLILGFETLADAQAAHEAIATPQPPASAQRQPKSMWQRPEYDPELSLIEAVKEMAAPPAGPAYASPLQDAYDLATARIKELEAKLCEEGK